MGTAIIRLLPALIAGACASLPERGAAVSAATLEKVPAGAYAIGPDNAQIAFSVAPLGLGRIDGSFAQFEGVLTIADAASGAASITARVRVDSAEMGREGYKEMMLGPGWFDAAQFPYSRFNGALAGWQGEGAGDFAGDLTIRDVTKAEVFDLRLSCDNVAECPGSAIGFSGELTIDRRAYGMTRLQGIVGADVTLRVSGTLDLRRDAAPPAIDAAPASPAAEAAPSP